MERRTNLKEQFTAAFSEDEVEPSSGLPNGPEKQGTEWTPKADTEIIGGLAPNLRSALRGENRNYVILRAENQPGG